MRKWTKKQWIELGLMVGGAFLMVSVMDTGRLSPTGAVAQPRSTLELIVTVAASVVVAYGVGAFARGVAKGWRALRTRIKGKPQDGAQ